ncbi:hypothetical protein FRC98_11335 [Lujinxingia vulgaris]|uniref:Uncharacterized protein n=1 Tax=Lujinxingia vulgaris TaxID=2600176 RepID=A0A5C6XIF6_9DELT|nr:hypothetical protein [Lujinxingia vulgaris]TXD37315.1 hypothetical protein FRC98_11335 [Lujinxingia vulgaris]
MAKISRLSGNMYAIHGNIASSVRVNSYTLSKRVEAKLFPNGVPPSVSVEDVIHALVEVLSRRYETFAELDRRVATELSRDRFLRGDRDACVVDLRQGVIATRGVVEGFWGREACRSVGLVGETPERPWDLLIYARQVHRGLEAGLADYMPLLGISVPDTREMAAGLKLKIDALDAKLSALGLEERGTQAAQNKRQEAAEDWNRHYVPVASIVESLYRLVDMPAHAERVRPTSRRKAGEAEQVDLEGIDDVDVLGEIRQEEGGEVSGGE